MLYRLRQRTTDESGFTLIELLVVVLIIGILAAIAIPSFLSQRQKAQDAEAKTDARTSQTAMETYFTNENNYNTNVVGLQKIEKSLNGSTLTAASGGPDTFTVTATSKTGTDFTVARAATGAVTRTCGPAAKKGEGACPNSGSW